MKGSFPLGTARRLAVLCIAVALTAPADAAASCGGQVRASAPKTLPPGHRRAYVIGDSTSIFAVPKLARRGLSANARGCRQFAEGLRLIRGRRRLPHLVVLALGTNGEISRRQLGQALRAVGRERVLGLVTPRNHGATAAAMRAFARDRPERVLLIDWRRFSAGHGSWFAPDGLHVGDTGATALASFIRRRARGVLAPPALRLLADPLATCGRVRRRRLQVVILRGPARCAAARAIARRPPMAIATRSRWAWFDWRPTRRGPWRDVYTRARRRWVVATRS